MKKPKQRLFKKSPSNSRIITDSAKQNLQKKRGSISAWIVGHWEIILTASVSAALTVVIMLVISNLDSNLKKREQLQKERTAIQQDAEFWQDVTQKYPNYRDAFFRVAVLEYQLGNIEKARLNLQKALKLDPNFIKGREFEKVLNSS